MSSERLLAPATWLVVGAAALPGCASILGFDEPVRRHDSATTAGNGQGTAGDGSGVGAATGGTQATGGMQTTSGTQATGGTGGKGGTTGGIGATGGGGASEAGQSGGGSSGAGEAGEAGQGGQAAGSGGSTGGTRAGNGDANAGNSGANAGNSGANAGSGGMSAGSGGTSGGSGASDGCTVMAKRCSGNGYETCDGSQTWGRPVACTGGYCNGEGVCGSCPSDTYRCSDEVGQVCDDNGNWTSNGSSILCTCSAPGRFTRAGQNLVLDTTTQLTWDSAMRALDTWTNASSICSSAGMRLPTYKEWTNVMLLGTACPMGTPFDQAAMPTSNADIGSGNPYNLWTGDPETGFPGDIVVVLLMWSSGTWTIDATDDPTTAKHNYRCVK